MNTEALLTKLPIDSIRESLTNPRQHFDETGIDELMASIGQLGIQVPLKVRPIHADVDLGEDPEAYELIGGARRLRAAVRLGLATVPCIVEEMSDSEAREAQIVENLQRADIHPVDEAESYRLLIADSAAHGLGRDRSAEDIARRLGKTPAYVAQRLKLLDLELDVKLLFSRGHLDLGHALLLAPLTPVDQERALRFMLNSDPKFDKRSVMEVVGQEISGHYAGRDVVEIGAAPKIAKNMWRGRRLIEATEIQLKRWIADNVMLRLSDVPWRLDDETLVKLAGACDVCPKRSGSNAALFSGITAEEDMCTDGACFQAKQKAHLSETARHAKEQGAPLLKLSSKLGEERLPEVIKPSIVYRRGQWLAAEPGSCDGAVKGLMKDGADTGKILVVCVHQACKVHKHRVDQVQQGGGVSAPDPKAAEREAKAKAIGDRERAIRKSVVAAMLPKAKKSPVAVLRHFVMGRIGDDPVADVCSTLGLPVDVPETAEDWERDQAAMPALEKYLTTATEEQVVAVAFHLLVASHLMPDAWSVINRLEQDRKELWAAAKALGVDADAIAKKVVAELTKKPAKVRAKKVAAKKAKPKPKKVVAMKKKPVAAKKKAVA